MNFNSSSTQGPAAGTPMTPLAASRIQSATAIANRGKVSSGSFAARAISAAARNSNIVRLGGGFRGRGK